MGLYEVPNAGAFMIIKWEVLQCVMGLYEVPNAGAFMIIKLRFGCITAERDIYIYMYICNYYCVYIYASMER